ncbi:MAG: aminoacyl-tRNA hydrolase [Proteobacteria bacterium]|nr:aminoacyl-tRNA hydrolase [Pseudomonadota bacterium]
MQPKRVRLVVGLGNPGDTYRKTRHNAGFMVADGIADFFSIALKKKKSFANLLYGRGFIDGVETILVKPMAYMNRSGPPIKYISNYFKILCNDILVIHDDIDLAFGRLKIKQKGGDGGHKGVRSLIDALGEDTFVRLRIGVGSVAAETDVTNHVLGRFNADEKKALNQIITRAREAVVTILCKGTEEGMNRFNDKTIVIYS